MHQFPIDNQREMISLCMFYYNGYPISTKRLLHETCSLSLDKDRVVHFNEFKNKVQVSVLYSYTERNLLYITSNCVPTKHLVQNEVQIKVSKTLINRLKTSLILVLVMIFI